MGIARREVVRCLTAADFNSGVNPFRRTPARVPVMFNCDPKKSTPVSSQEVLCLAKDRKLVPCLLRNICSGTAKVIDENMQSKNIFGDPTFSTTIRPDLIR